MKRTLPNIELDIKMLKILWEKSTSVVAWYSNYKDRGEIRGPFCRWLKVSEVEPEYQKNVASIADDAEYATAAMNSVPHLIAAYESQCDHSARLAGQLELYKREIEFLSNRLTELYEQMEKK